MPFTVYPEPYQLPIDEHTPEAVLASARATAEAIQRRRQAADELAAARAALDQADAVDRAAAQKAVAANKAVPDAKAGAKARAALSAAQRKLEASEADYKEKSLALTDLIIERRDEWTAELAEQDAELAQEIASTIDRFRDLRARRQRVAAKLATLPHFKAADRPGRRLDVWSGTSLGGERRPKDPATIRARVDEEVRSQLRVRRRYSINESEVDALLAELELMALGIEPWREPTA